MAQRQLRSVLVPAEVLSRSPASDQTLQEYGFDPVAAKALAQGGLPQGRVNILSDLPAREDALGFAPLVRTLCNIVLSRSTETPITIAIDGPWGSGKTSILRMIELQARMVGFSCIWLNAWNLESAENLIAAIAREVQEELNKRQEVDTKAGKKILNFITSALTYLAPISDKAGALSKALSLKQEAIESGIKEVASVVSSHQAFKDLVELLLSTQNTSSPRLLVFIDDVDRALPDQVAIILKNLKLVLESEKCIFLLAMDMSLVARAIEDHYLKNAARIGDGRPDPDFGIKYLEKLVQLRVAVPRLSKSNLNPFLESLSIAPEIAQILAWAPEAETLNPRRLKKFINWLSLTLQLLNAAKLPAAIDNENILKLMMLRRYYSEFYQLLVRTPEWWVNLPQLWHPFRGLLNNYDVVALAHFMEPLTHVDLRYAEKLIAANSLLDLDGAIKIQFDADDDLAPPSMPNDVYDLTVVLIAPGERKLEVIKSVTSLTNLSLREATELVGQAPTVIKEGLGKVEALRVRALLEMLGAKIELYETNYTAVLVAFREHKIEVIKEVRALTGLGLKEAKDLVEAAPKVLKRHVRRDEAQKIKGVLEAVGAKVELYETEFAVVLEAFGEKKIEVIKEVRMWTGLGLKEAKDLVESTPKILKQGLRKSDVVKIKAAFERVGARIQIRALNDDN